MENREELLMEILKRVQRNYRHMVEIERVTKEMADALSRNDQESAQLLMKMRQDELERFLDSKREIQMLAERRGQVSAGSVRGEEDLRTQHSASAGPETDDRC